MKTENEPSPQRAAAAYRVLAIKYRPQTLEDLVGQDHIKTTLSNAITSGRVAHAFLFSGSRGTGKTTTARILAKALNCLKGDGPTAAPCGVCAACREITKSSDLDVLEIDGASNNSVDQIRDLRGTIENKPVRDRYRVVIIDEVHMLSIAAFNALLKTLEEPPAHVKFIFATTDPHKLPDTIHSRCQHYDFRRLTTEEIVASLTLLCERENVSAEAGVFETIASISDGGLRDAQSKLDQVIAFRGNNLVAADVERIFGLVGRAWFLDLIAAFRRGDASGALAKIDELFQQGKDIGVFLGTLTRLLRDLLIVNACGSADALRARFDDQAAFESEARAWKRDALVYAIDLLCDASRRLRGGGEERIALEVLALRLSALPDLRPVQEIIAAVKTFDFPAPGRPNPAASSLSAPRGPSPAGMGGRSSPRSDVPPGARSPEPPDAESVESSDGGGEEVRQAVELTREVFSQTAKEEQAP